MLRCGGTLQASALTYTTHQEKWYTQGGTPQPDPTASLILSGFGLGMSVVANALLIIRFSLEDQAWRMATYVSVIFWIIKVSAFSTFRLVIYLNLRQTILSTVNLVVFGALTRNSPGFAYDEGFWCACVSSTLRLKDTVDSI